MNIGTSAPKAGALPLGDAPKICWFRVESKKVSYLDAISFAKAIIVTSDSVSMVTESCSTGKPTYIIDIPTKSKKFSLFIKNLIDLKLAYYLKYSISLKNRNKALNDIDEVVKKIKKKIKF